MRSFILLVTILLISCNQSQNKPDVDKQKDGLVKSYSKDGKILSEINYKDGKRNGIGKSYYGNGSIQLEIPYIDDKRHGVVKKYYENGKIYQETQFTEDKQTGTQKTYRENGKLWSEARYEDGMACTGVKEYLLNGSSRKKYPSIITQVVDRMQERGEYIVYVSLSDKSGRVKFYRGELSQSGCVNNKMIELPFNKQTRQAELKFTLPVGAFVMEEVNIIAEVSTLARSRYITQKKINIAIDN